MSETTRLESTRRTSSRSRGMILAAVARHAGVDHDPSNKTHPRVHREDVWRGTSPRTSSILRVGEHADDLVSAVDGCPGDMRRPTRVGAPEILINHAFIDQAVTGREPPQSTPLRMRPLFMEFRGRQNSPDYGVEEAPGLVALLRFDAGMVMLESQRPPVEKPLACWRPRPSLGAASPGFLSPSGRLYLARLTVDRRGRTVNVANVLRLEPRSTSWRFLERTRETGPRRSTAEGRQPDLQATKVFRQAASARVLRRWSRLLPKCCSR